MAPNLRFWILISILFHIIGFVLLTVQFNLFKKEQPQILKVQLISLPKGDAKPVKPKPLEKIKTQASVAPKEAPKNIDTPQKATEAPKVQIKEKVAEKEKPKPKPPVKKEKPKAQEKQQEAKPRPAKLDKTPDKEKAIRSKDPDAKTVAKVDDDFLKALDFLKELEQEELKTDEKPTQKFEPEEDDVLLTLDDLNFADRESLLKIRKTIEKQWILPSGLRNANELSAVIEIRLKEDGHLKSLKVVKSSGKKFFDDSLLRAVRKAVPLPIPPTKYELFRAIELHFTGK